MSLLNDSDEPDATPLVDDDIEGLIPYWVTTRAQLNEQEQANIEVAVRWLYQPRSPVRSAQQLLNAQFSDRLHRRMFDQVWTWAGKRRARETNIGIDPAHIAAQMKLAFDDAIYWHTHGTFAAHEFAVRLHHRVVCIHPYPNGNGRQTRLMADAYVRLAGAEPLTWGGGAPLDRTDVIRRTYIDALKVATSGEIGPLLEFATRH